MRGFVGCRYTSIRAVAPHLCQSLGCLSHSLYQHCSQDSFFYRLMMAKGFPCGSAGKESACNEGDLGSIPGSGRSPGEGNGTPLHNSCLENPMGGGAWWATVHGVANSRTWLNDFTFTFMSLLLLFPWPRTISNCHIWWTSARNSVGAGWEQG